MKNFSFIDNIMENPTIKKIVKPVKKLFNKNKKKKKKINEYEKQFGLILNDMDNSYDDYATINDMNYNVVKSKDFIHNNMVKNTSRRDTGINYSNIDRKNGLFTGNDIYKNKQEVGSLFKPMSNNIYGMKSITDKLQVRYNPGLKQNNGDLPFEHNIKVQPGLNGKNQKGIYNINRFLPKNIDQLRTKNNKKLKSKERPTIPGKKGDKRSILSKITRKKRTKLKENKKSDLLPNNSNNKRTKIYGLVKKSTKQNFNTNYIAPGIKTSNGNIIKGKFRNSKKTTLLNDNNNNIRASVNKITYNKESYKMNPNKKINLNAIRPEHSVDTNKGKYYKSKDLKLKTNNRNTYDNIDFKKIDKVKNITYMKHQDKVKIPIKYHNIINKYISAISNNNDKTYVPLLDELNIPLKYHNIINKYAGSINNSNNTYVPLLDDLNIPLKYHNIINQYVSAINDSNNTYVPLLDNLGIPIKYHTIINNYVNIIKDSNDTYVPLQDNAKNTIKQTTINTKQIQPIFEGMIKYKPFTDNAKVTIKETTYMNNYKGSAINENIKERSRVDANNMCINDIKEQTIDSRPGNGRQDGSHILDKNTFDMKNNIVFRRNNIGGLSLNTNMNVMKIYTRNKSKLKETDYYTNNLNKVALKDNPYALFK